MLTLGRCTESTQQLPLTDIVCWRPRKYLRCSPSDSTFPLSQPRRFFTSGTRQRTCPLHVLPLSFRIKVWISSCLECEPDPTFFDDMQELPITYDARPCYFCYLLRVTCHTAIFGRFTCLCKLKDCYPPMSNFAQSIFCDYLKTSTPLPKVLIAD